MLYPPPPKKKVTAENDVFFLEKQHFVFNNKIKDHLDLSSARPPDPSLSSSPEGFLNYKDVNQVRWMKREDVSPEKTCTRYRWWFRNPKQPPNMYETLVNHGIFYHINWLAGFLPSTPQYEQWATPCFFFWFMGNLRRQPPRMLTTPRMREWKGTMMLAKSPNKKALFSGGGLEGGLPLNSHDCCI